MFSVAADEAMSWVVLSRLPFELCSGSCFVGDEPEEVAEYQLSAFIPRLKS